MRTVVLALALPGCVSPHATQRPATAIAAAPIAAAPGLPPATGARLVLQHYPCFGACPVATITVYETGLVDWYGHVHVSRLGAERTSVPPSEALALFDAWAALDLDALSAIATAEGTDVHPDGLTHAADGVSTTRFPPVRFRPCAEPCRDADADGCASRCDEEAALQRLIDRIDDAADGRTRFATPQCERAIFVTGATMAFRVPEAELEIRMEPVDQAVARLQKDPTHVVRVMGLEDDRGELLANVRFHREALQQADIASDRVIVTTLPRPTEGPAAAYAGYGALEVGPRSCFPTATR